MNASERVSANASRLRTLSAAMRREVWVLRSPLAPERCAARLVARLTGPPIRHTHVVGFPSRHGHTPSEPPYELRGWADREGFLLQWVTRSNMPEARGRMAPDGDGTRIELSLGAPPRGRSNARNVAAFLGACWVFAIVAQATDGGPAADDPDGRSWLMLVGFTAFFALVVALLLRAARADKLAYLDLLRWVLRAEVVRGPLPEDRTNPAEASPGGTTVPT